MKKALYIALLFISNSFSQNLDDNLLLHYQFNGDTNDASENNYHGTANGVTYVLDRFDNPNGAAYFDGINDFIDLPNLIELKPDLPVSFSFWINYDSDNYQDRAVFNTSLEDDRSSGIYFNTQIATGNYAVNYGDGTYNYISSTRRTYVSNEPIENENWHHIAVVVRSATDMSIYVDCVEYGGEYSGTGGNLVYSDTPGSIGRNDRNLNIPANYFKGSLDDFRYWDRELLVSEIDDLCEGELSIEEVELVKNELLIFPNPTNGIINIKTNAEFESFSIYNALGQHVLSNSFKPTIDIRHLNQGVYYINLIKNDLTVSKQIILNFH